MRVRTYPRGRTAALMLAGIVAGSLLSGPAMAHTGKKIGHLTTKHLDAIYLNQTEKAADSNQLDGLDSTAFLRSNGKAADSDKLDGIDSAGFLLAGGKAADSDKLDNLDSTAFELTSTVRSLTARMTMGDPDLTLGTWGPFTLTGRCTDAGGGEAEPAVRIATSENNALWERTVGGNFGDDDFDTADTTFLADFTAAVAGTQEANEFGTNFFAIARSGTNITGVIDLAAHMGAGADCVIGGYVIQSS